MFIRTLKRVLAFFGILLSIVVCISIINKSDFRKNGHINPGKYISNNLEENETAIEALIDNPNNINVYGNENENDIENGIGYEISNEYENVNEDEYGNPNENEDGDENINIYESSNDTVNIDETDNSNGSTIENVKEEIEEDEDMDHDQDQDQDQDKDVNDSDSEDVPEQTRKKTDDEYIKGYKGGKLEPEWKWVRNISIVYTWVDGKDVNFQDEKSKFNGGYRTYNSRDRSADELRYSLRSVEKYLPWHNGTIYIVTNKQVPKWLNTTHPRIQMVYHEEIIPEHYRPTYDSNVIELFFDRIPGITERFLYFNDDIFINNYIHPCFFFTSKNFYPKIYRGYVVPLNKDKVDRIIRKNSVRDMFMASKYFTRETVKKYFDPKYRYYYLLHTVYVIYRDLMEPFRQLFQDEVRLICADRFRSPYEPHSLYLYQDYLYYATKHPDFPLKLGGKGKAARFVGSPLPEKADRTIQTYSCKKVPPSISKKYIKFGSVTNNYNLNEKKFNSFKNDPNLLVYNFNDEYSKEDSLFQFSEYMITRYPEPTAFEKQEYIDLELAIHPIFDKINDLSNTMSSHSPQSNKNNDNEFKNQLKQYKLNTVSEYLDSKEALSTTPQSEISQRENQEIKILTNYHGEALTEEWQWASDISIVYLLQWENRSNTIIHEVDKLKYSLRSLNKYLPWWKGTLFLVVSGTIFSERDFDWLNIRQGNSNDDDGEGEGNEPSSSHQTVQLIYARDILPKEKRYSTNRYITELYLDQIPGLSERFLYLQSNSYFLQYAHPRVFFSPEFYPKYNFKLPLAGRDLRIRSSRTRPFFKTYDLIKTYFDASYFRSYRYLYEAPYPLYRDLFEPTRQLFKQELREWQLQSQKYTLLPLYLVINYNIYGTAQPFYPDYVAGYGKVRNATAPILNPERTIDYYGFDITSPSVVGATLQPEVPFTTDISNNQNWIEQIKRSTKKIFFSFKFVNNSKFSSEIKDQFMQFMNSLYKEKSPFESS